MKNPTITHARITMEAIDIHKTAGHQLVRPGGGTCPIVLVRYTF